MRENKGEIEFAKKSGTIDSNYDNNKLTLSNLIQYGTLRGDLEVHSNNTDGLMSIEDISLAAKEQFGLEYIAITDHTKSLAFAHGLNENRLLDQVNNIRDK
jgi:DNA polymerase (family X)